MRLSRNTATGLATALLVLGLASNVSFAQPGQGGGFGIDPRAESRSYYFEDTDEQLPYCMFVSSKVDLDEPAPLIIALHGMGAPPDIMCNATAIVNVSISREQWVPTIDELGIEHEYVELPGVTHGPVITESQEAIFRFFGEHSK